MSIELLIYIPLVFIAIGVVGYGIPIVYYLLRYMFESIASGVRKISESMRSKKPAFQHVTYFVEEQPVEQVTIPKKRREKRVKSSNVVTEIKPVITQSKAIAMNDINKGTKVLKDMESLIEKLTNESKKKWVQFDYEKAKAQILGDLEVINHIKSMDKNIKFLYDITLEYESELVHFDHIIISDKGVYVLDSSSINCDVYVDEAGNFFKVDENGNHTSMYSPINDQEHKANILIDKLNEIGLDFTLPIYSTVIVCNHNANIEMEAELTGLCPDYKHFLKYVEDSDEPNSITNRIGHMLSEFNEGSSINYLEEYNIQPEDFFKHA